MISKLLQVLLFGTVVSTTAPDQHPIKARFSSELITESFNARDHELFKLFHLLNLTPKSHPKDSKFSQTYAYIIPSKTKPQDHDFIPSYTSDYLGFESDKLSFKGSGRFFDGKKNWAFRFDGPVSLFKIQYKLVGNPDQIKRYHHIEKRCDVSVDSLNIIGPTLSREEKQELLDLLKESVFAMGDHALTQPKDLINRLPMDIALPF